MSEIIKHPEQPTELKQRIREATQKASEFFTKKEKEQKAIIKMLESSVDLVVLNVYRTRDPFNWRKMVPSPKGDEEDEPTIELVVEDVREDEGFKIKPGEAFEIMCGVVFGDWPEGYKNDRGVFSEDELDNLPESDKAAAIMIEMMPYRAALLAERFECSSREEFEGALSERLYDSLREDDTRFVKTLLGFSLEDDDKPPSREEFAKKLREGAEKEGLTDALSEPVPVSASVNNEGDSSVSLNIKEILDKLKKDNNFFSRYIKKLVDPIEKAYQALITKD